ncbi:MaoC/PaaZ C-terminal domain-containing protein [Hamadaea tsunoensis]|uniref:MaoC/PaaZ C-terminal domain-containing protein n=1 Tax=Hamadaea tsunoensis TaxID=53368 RepID=UPI0007E8DD9A|nr:MaoC/PaaZ C-terminal domain-containing protein [Hamadaea tsunoensis]
MMAFTRDWALTPSTLVAYAGATWDWHRLHHDAAYAAGRGLPAPIVDGQMFGALLAELVLGWAGPGAVLRSLHLRFAAPVYAGETVRCTGQVTAVNLDVVSVDLRVEVPADGRIAVRPAGAEVGLASADRLARLRLLTSTGEILG